MELGVPFIDLNAMSKIFYAALGPEKSARGFAAPGGNVDNTHHNNYGSYELAKCILEGIRSNKLGIMRFLMTDVPRFDPNHPDAFESFKVPASTQAANVKPLGS